MAKNVDKRLSDLEHDTGPGDEVKITVNWRDDDLILDENTGELVTRKEWQRRHPNVRLKIVTWDEDDYTSDPVPVG